jgi:hypothetical protein
VQVVLSAKGAASGVFQIARLAAVFPPTFFVAAMRTDEAVFVDDVLIVGETGFGIYITDVKTLAVLVALRTFWFRFGHHLSPFLLLAFGVNLTPATLRRGKRKCSILGSFKRQVLAQSES